MAICTSSVAAVSVVAVVSVRTPSSDPPQAVNSGGSAAINRSMATAAALVDRDMCPMTLLHVFSGV
jgi:hypothetical protein